MNFVCYSTFNCRKATLDKDFKDMPELPEVETTLRGIEPYISSYQVVSLTVRQPSLRWPVTENIGAIVSGQ